MTTDPKNPLNQLAVIILVQLVDAADKKYITHANRIRVRAIPATHGQAWSVRVDARCFLVYPPNDQQPFADYEEV